MLNRCHRRTLHLPSLLSAILHSFSAQLVHRAIKICSNAWHHRANRNQFIKKDLRNIEVQATVECWMHISSRKLEAEKHGKTSPNNRISSTILHSKKQLMQERVSSSGNQKTFHWKKLYAAAAAGKVIFVGCSFGGPAAFIYYYTVLCIYPLFHKAYAVLE